MGLGVVYGEMPTAAPRARENELMTKYGLIASLLSAVWFAKTPA